MKIDLLWNELEKEGPSTTGWLSRIARPVAGAYPLLVAIHQATHARALLLPASKDLLPPRSEWPDCSGLELSLVAVAGKPHVCVKLRERASADVFTVLAEELAERISAARDRAGAVSILFDQLNRWQLFLAAARSGMGVERQRGLFGELHVLVTHLLPRIGPMAAVQAWKGSASAHQDFQLARGALEVKTSAAKQPATVTITSERQLDDTGAGALFLHVVHVDERDVPSAPAVSGECLPEIVRRIRAQLVDAPAASAQFEEKLLLAGWLESQSSRYDDRRWTIRSERSFRVRDRFPRITESDLPAGIGHVSYELDLSACDDFSVPFDELAAEILGFRADA